MYSEKPQSPLQKHLSCYSEQVKVLLIVNSMLGLVCFMQVKCGGKVKQWNGKQDTLGLKAYQPRQWTAQGNTNHWLDDWSCAISGTSVNTTSDNVNVFPQCYYE